MQKIKLKIITTIFWIIDVTNEKEINIKSNCLFFRPLIFNYKGQYIDVYHG
jgi:hypothetical protein